MKKVLVLHGSYRIGNTHKTALLLMDRLQSKGNIEFEEIRLHDLNIPFCRGCNACIETDEKLCPASEIISELENKISSSDGLILGSPVYCLNVNGGVKNLIDHFGYRIHRPFFFKQDAVMITTTSGIGSKRVANYLKKISIHLGFRNIYTLPIVCGDDLLQESPKLIHKINKTADKFYSAVSSKKLYSPNINQIVAFNLFRASALTGKEKNNADYRYFHESGLLYKNHYHQLSGIKNLFASQIFTIMKKLIK